MATRGKQVEISRSALEACVRTALPHLASAEAADVARIVSTLVHTFDPESIFAFGSQARGTPSDHSDIDLLVVVQDAGAFPHHLAQEAYRVVGRHILPLDVLFMSRDEFERRSEVVTSLPASVLREGKLLYAAAS